MASSFVRLSKIVSVVVKAGNSAGASPSGNAAWPDAAAPGPLRGRGIAPHSEGGVHSLLPQVRQHEPRHPTEDRSAPRRARMDVGAPNAARFQKHVVFNVVWTV